LLSAKSSQVTQNQSWLADSCNYHEH
jgi:hypothetical protein